MKGLIGFFLMIIGVAWAAMLGLMALLELLFGGKNSQPMNFVYIMPVGGVLLILGGILYLAAKREAKKQEVRAVNIYENGIPGRGRVTFVDKNYSLLVNNKPVYSIVEFTFEDHQGRPHTGRKENVDSDLVIRAQIAVGSEVDIKYLASNPDESALLIHEPGWGREA